MDYGEVDRSGGGLAAAVRRTVIERGLFCASLTGGLPRGAGDNGGLRGAGHNNGGLPCGAGEDGGRALRVAAAVSGGMDSMTLLHLLRERAAEWNITLCAVNIEHGIRGAESRRDSDFVRGYCADNGIPLYFEAADAPAYAAAHSGGIEAAARALRFAFFNRLIDGGVADRVALAHHSDDNAETVLLNLFRGGGARGLRGMEYVRDGRFVRPFLDVSRAMIADYADKNKIPYVTDSSNEDTAYNRNFIRREILPRVAARFNGAAGNIAAAARRIGRDNAFIEACADTMPPERARECPAVLSRLIFRALRTLNAADIEEKHVDIIIDLIRNGRNGACIDLPGNLRARREYGRVTFIRECADGTRTEYIKIGADGLRTKSVKTEVEE
jgi:tRNA(Ile)-lysidine synthase